MCQNLTVKSRETGRPAGTPGRRTAPRTRAAPRGWRRSPARRACRPQLSGCPQGRRCHLQAGFNVEVLFDLVRRGGVVLNSWCEEQSGKLNSSIGVST